MTKQTHKIAVDHDTTDNKNAFRNLFNKPEEFWLPHRSMAKTFLQTQQSASILIEAYRQMMDKMREIIRKEQDLVFEISNQAFKGVVENGWSTKPDATEMNNMFGRRLAGLRALGDVWMNAQQGSLDALFSHLPEDRARNATRQSDKSAATSRPAEGDAKSGSTAPH